MEKKSHPRPKGSAPSRRAFLQTAGTGIATVAGITLLSRRSRADDQPFAYISLADQLSN
jgi:hypothetical protein